MKLSLGVFDIPYVDAVGKTTGDVAEILEEKYHVMEIFYEENKQDVADDLASAFVGSLESVVMGARLEPRNFFNAGTSKIEKSFKDFLSTGKIETLGYPGVPTKAALKRKSGRFKKGRAPKPRPSFIDTGQYEASFRAWVDD